MYEDNERQILNVDVAIQVQEITLQNFIHTCIQYLLRDRPFNLKGVGAIGVFLEKKILSTNLMNKNVCL